MQTTDPLIRTKLRLPYIRPGLVSRPRLQEKIMQGLYGPLTLIAAPAGFGKTTLLASCVVGCGMPAAWLSLDKNDNQPGRFLTYLIAAIQAVDQQIGSEAAQLMTGIQQALPEVVLTSLINDLDSANREMILVLDDYQLITSHAVHEQVAFLLEHRPNTLHLVIATRSDPPLPLARLRARGQAVEVRAADLRFTAEEAAQFLNDVMGLNLDVRLVELLEERTEGWIAGLQMASLALQSSPFTRERKNVLTFIEGFSGTNRYILDYLLEEVLASQPPEIQHFLLCTSILERLTAPLCDALLAGGEDFAPSPLLTAASVLEYLDRENLFLVPLDEAWFRYHHLFSDLLKIRLRQAHTDLVSRLHIQAATWLEQNGFIPEAVQHFFAAQETGRAADLIERYGPARWAESDPSVFQLADNLPPDMFLSRPKIGLYYAWLLIIQGLVERALPLLNDLARHLAGTNPDPSQRWMQTIIALALAFIGQRKSAVPFDPFTDDRVLDEIPADETILLDTAEILYGMTLARRGEIDRAAEVGLKCLQRRKTTIGALAYGTLTIPNLVPFLARMYLIQGRLHEAAALCHQFLDPIQKKGVRFINSAGSMNITLGDVLYEWNALEEAEKQIRDGLQANEPWVDIMTEGFGLLALTRVLLAKGEYSAAMLIVEEFDSRLQQNLRPHEFEEDLRTLKARVQLASGDLHSAVWWADQILLSEDFRLHPERYRLTLARIRLAQGRFIDAEKILTDLPNVSGVGSQTARKIESTLLLAEAVFQQQRVQEAFRFIDECLDLAAPENHIRAFLDAGEPVRDLLIAYRKSADPGKNHFLQKLLDAFPPSIAGGSPGPQQTGLIEPLSERELEVLRLMALGRTNEEIAQQLIVARGTIKAHAASIYRKLDVNNRTEAVARARQLEMLS